MKKIFLVGNPNTGKTTLLNTMACAHEHTGNWHGVTVEEKEKVFEFENQTFSVTDLPGIYSLNSLGFEEELAIKHIFQNPCDIIVNTCDINTLRKNLFLTLDLLLAGKTNLVLVVNTMGQKTASKNFDTLKKALGIEVLCLDFSQKQEVAKLMCYIKNFQPNQTKQNHFKTIFSGKTYENLCLCEKHFGFSKFETIKLIEKNNYFINKKNKNKSNLLNFEINNSISQIDLAKEKYDFIDSVFQKKSTAIYGKSVIDRLLLNKFLAVPCFFLIMLFVFWLTFFGVGAWLSDVLLNLVQVQFGGVIVSWLETICNVPWVIGLVQDGFFGGVCSLLGFLPQIVMLFLFLSIMEDTGYFARVAFVFEDVFASIGLSGKSIYTLLMGFGCSASAVVTTRALDNKNAKIKTAMVTPFMSCSAKLPVYAVIGGAFFGAANVWVVFLLYILGVFCAIFVSILLDKFLLPNPKGQFLQEFPPYRVPKFKKVLSLTFQNMKAFLIKVFTIFVSMSVIVWCLGSFDFSLQYGTNESILQSIGKVFAPIFAPLGFDNWGAVSALLAGFVAKEVIVSSIAIFNGQGAGADLGASILDPESAVWFTAGGALSFLVFCLLYTPCLATVAILKKEIGAKFTLLAVVIQFALAYLMAFVTFNLFKLSCIIGFASLCLVVALGMVILFSVIRVTEFLCEKNKCKHCGRCK